MGSERRVASAELAALPALIDIPSADTVALCVPPARMLGCERFRASQDVGADGWRGRASEGVELELELGVVSGDVAGRFVDLFNGFPKKSAAASASSGSRSTSAWARFASMRGAGRRLRQRDALRLDGRLVKPSVARAISDLEEPRRNSGAPYMR